VEHNSAGDMVKQSWSFPPNYTAEYEYYTDKASRAGDFYQYLDLISYGSGRVFSPAHLLKRIKHNDTRGIITDFVYEFDEYDRITKMTITEDGITRVITLQQSCD
jgi:hypothetical protein